MGGASWKAAFHDTQLFDIGWFPSSSLGTNCWQAPACRVSGSWSYQGRVPKLELSSLYTSVRGPSFRHPCRNDGVFGSAGLVYNDESWSLGTSKPCLQPLVVGCADGGGAPFAIDALRSSAHPTALFLFIRRNMRSTAIAPYRVGV